MEKKHKKKRFGRAIGSMPKMPNQMMTGRAKKAGRMYQPKPDMPGESPGMKSKRRKRTDAYAL